MDNGIKDIQFQLGWGEKSLIQEYIDNIANKGLTKYKAIIQTGAKEGESLYTHVLNGIFVFERLRPLLGVSEIEARVIMTTYSVHDLNKVEQFAQYGSYNKLGIKANFEEELESLEMPTFFPDYKAYLEDITTLARTHSAHLHTEGELLVKSYNPYKLGKERIEQLRHVMRAMDTIVLSKTLTERAKKNEFLSHLNTFFSTQTPVKQYEFHTHSLSENRGILTNIIHNRIAEYLEQHYQMIPLAFYPDGVSYLAEKGQSIIFADEQILAISQSVSAAINKMTRSKFSTEFINSTMQGIKVDSKFKELGMSFDEIFTEIYNLIVRRTYQKRLDDMVETARKRTVKTLQEKAEKLNEQSQRDPLLQQAQHIAQLPAIMPDSDGGMQVGELLRSYYIFLSDHYKKSIPNSWEYLYNLLQIEHDRRTFYDAFDPRFDRPYVVAKDLNLSVDEMQARILADGQNLFAQSIQPIQASLYEGETPITRYLRKHLNFSFLPPQKADFFGNLQEYITNQHAQCCYCGSEFDTANWMKANVSDAIKVQYFSNRLEGGQREPKRYICDICNIQFILYKLNYPTLCPGGMKTDDITTYYLHIFPYAFYPDVFLHALQAEIRHLQGMSVESLYLKTEAAIRESMQSELPELHFSGVKRNGFPLPKFSEIQGNVLLFPLNSPGDNETERFLFAVENALLMHQFLGCKVILTDSAVCVWDKSEFADVYIDAIPIAFSGLLPANNLSQPELETVWTRLKSLYAIKGLVFSDGKELPKLLRALTDDPFTLFYVCERLMLKKIRTAKGTADKDGLEINFAKKITDILNNMLERGEKMEQLKILAKIAWEGKIKGKSLKKNALMLPFDLAFEKLQQKTEQIDLETVQAALVEDISGYLDRVTEEKFKPKRTVKKQEKRDQIKSFVNAFFSGLLQGVYNNNVNKLLADEKILKSAFLFYVREQISGKDEEEEDNE